MSYYRYKRKPRQPKPAHLTGDALKARIEALRDNPNADEWTQKFCGSILEGFNKYGGLTQRQYDIFAKNEKKFSDEAIQSRNEWRAKYGDKERAIARICAEYYKANPPYFGDLAERILTDPDFIPSEKAYRSMTENKYAARVLAGHVASALYPNGSMVELRASGPYRSLGDTNRGVVIASDAAAVTSAAKGCKKYEVLPIGAAKTVIIEERYLKRAKKLKKK